MYDENLSILEGADYAADTFWLEGEELKDSFPFGEEQDLELELDLVSIDRMSSLIRDLSENLDERFFSVRDAGYNASQAIDKFVYLYNKIVEEY